jgi:ketosteroid isomerase-like protein
VIASALLVTTCAATPAPPDTAKDEADVAAAVKAFQTAMDTGDAPTVMQYLAADALMMEGGTIETREQYEKAHLPADLEFAKDVKTTRNPVRQTIDGDVAWVTTSTDFVGTFQGKPVDFLGLETMVLHRQPEGWRIRAIHWSSRNRLPRT